MPFSTLLTHIPGYPLLSKDTLNKCLEDYPDTDSLKKELVRLKRLKACDEAIDEGRLAEINKALINHDALSALLKESDTDATHFFQIANAVFESETISDEASLALAHAMMAEIIKHQTKPLLGLASFIIRSENPFLIAAYLSKLVTQTDPKAIISSGLLSKLFQNYMAYMDVLKKAYQLFADLLKSSERDKSAKENGEALLELAKTHTVDERGYEFYTLSAIQVPPPTPAPSATDAGPAGEGVIAIRQTAASAYLEKPKTPVGGKNEAGLIVAPIKDLLLNVTITQRNLECLYTLFGLDFLIALMKTDPSEPDEKVVLAAFIDSEIVKLKDDDLLGFFSFLNTFPTYTTLRQRVIGKITTAQKACLLKSAHKWVVLLDDPTLIEAMKYHELEQLITEDINEETLSTFLHIYILKKEEFAPFKKQIATVALNLFYRFPTLAEDYTTHRLLSSIPEFKALIENDYKSIHEQFEHLIIEKTRGTVDLDSYIDIERLYFEVARKRDVLQNFGFHARPYPKDKYALHTLLIEKAYDIHADLDIEALLEVFHTEAQYLAYPDPVLEQTKGMCQTLITALTHTSNEALCNGLFSVLKTKSTHHDCWDLPYQGITLSEHLIETAPARFLKLLFLGAEKNEEKASRLLTFEEKHPGQAPLIQRCHEELTIVSDLLPLYPADKRVALLQAKVPFPASYISFRQTTILRRVLSDEACLDSVLKIIPVNQHLSLFYKDTLGHPYYGNGLNAVDFNTIKKIMAGMTVEEKKTFFITPLTDGKECIGNHFANEPDFLTFLGTFLDADAISDYILSSGLLLKTTVELGLEHYKHLYLAVDKAKRHAYIKDRHVKFWANLRVCLPVNAFKDKFKFVINDLSPADVIIAAPNLLYTRDSTETRDRGTLQVLIDELSKKDGWLDEAGFAKMLLSKNQNGTTLTALLFRTNATMFIDTLKTIQPKTLALVLEETVDEHSVIEQLLEEACTMGHLKSVSTCLLALSKEDRARILNQRVSGTPLLYNADFTYDYFKILLLSLSDSHRSQLLGLEDETGQLYLRPYYTEPAFFALLKISFDETALKTFILTHGLTAHLAQTDEGLRGLNDLLGESKVKSLILADQDFWASHLYLWRVDQTKIDRLLKLYTYDEKKCIVRRFFEQLKDHGDKGLLPLLERLKSHLQPDDVFALLIMEDSPQKTILSGSFANNIDACLAYFKIEQETLSTDNQALIVSYQQKQKEKEREIDAAHKAQLQDICISYSHAFGAALGKRYAENPSRYENMVIKLTELLSTLPDEMKAREAFKDHCLSYSKVLQACSSTGCPDDLLQILTEPFGIDAAILPHVDEKQIAAHIESVIVSGTKFTLRLPFKDRRDNFIKALRTIKAETSVRPRNSFSFFAPPPSSGRSRKGEMQLESLISTLPRLGSMAEVNAVYQIFYNHYETPRELGTIVRDKYIEAFGVEPPRNERGSSLSPSQNALTFSM